MAKEEILSIARSYRRKLLESGISVAYLFLFGSQASDMAQEWSDIDIAVVSEDFGHDRFKERVALTRISACIDLRIEPYPLGLKEFMEEGWRMMIHEIKENGIEVAA